MTTPEILPYPEIPSENKAKKLVVFIHGLGSDGNDLIALTPFFQVHLQEAHYISPHGVEPCDMAPYGRQWFSLIDRRPDVIKNLAAQNAKHLEAIIQAKQKELGLSNKDTILVGFSQGTMIGTYVTLNQKEPYAALIAYSGRLISPAEIHNKDTPICIVHGMDDEIVLASESKDMADFLSKENIPNEMLIIDNLNHSINNEGIKFAANFLNNHLKNEV